MKKTEIFRSFRPQRLLLSPLFLKSYLQKGLNLHARVWYCTYLKTLSQLLSLHYVVRYKDSE